MPNSTTTLPHLYGDGEHDDTAAIKARKSAPAQNPTTLSDYECGYRDGVTVAAEDIKRLRANTMSVQRSAFDAGYDAARDGQSRSIAYGLWSNESNTDV